MKLLLLLSVAYAAFQQVRPKECSEEIINEMDECAERMAIVGSVTMKWPENDEGIKEYCRVHKESSDCIKKNSLKCLDPLRRSVINTYANSGLHLNKKYCKNGKVPDLDPYIPCLKRSNAGTHKCMQTLITELEAIADMGEMGVPEPVGRACCRFGDYKECVYSAAKRAECNEEQSQFTAQLVQDIIFDTLEMVCLGYETGSSTCNEFERPDISKRTIQSKSIVDPMLRILKFYI